MDFRMPEPENPRSELFACVNAFSFQTASRCHLFFDKHKVFGAFRIIHGSIRDDDVETRTCGSCVARKSS